MQLSFCPSWTDVGTDDIHLQSLYQYLTLLLVRKEAVHQQHSQNVTVISLHASLLHMQFIFQHAWQLGTIHATNGHAGTDMIYSCTGHSMIKNKVHTFMNPSSIVIYTFSAVTAEITSLSYIYCSQENFSILLIAPCSNSTKK